jgi:hypothetical protein
MRTGWALLLALTAGAWMCGCAAGAPEQIEEGDPSMLGGMSGGGGTGGAGGSAGRGGSGGSGGRSGSGGNAGTPAPASGSGSSADGGMTMDGGQDSGSGSGDQCTDGDKNGTETGTDCGGPDCDPCEDGTGCVIDSDCESEYCGSGFTCSSPGCDDDAQNGDETDVDCGGGDCPGCAIGRDCADDDDCMSGACEDDQCVCRPLDECGAEECGQKLDGCGGMVDCSHECESTEMCQANACVPAPLCVARDCPRCGFLDLQSGCCKSDDTCGCPPLFGSGCN